ncbi:regulator of nucleoside diphosphate kinase [Azonexus fungiphilus]|jgi:regulator of nucleoside diphosphate kinase|uniref:Regulator of nucleoside diphosphate kinase n=1 Tax=Azonexus fungiphilus TaxID=146940 RepID=A0A495WDK3_9RHOO|nr:nucleoside diphosphate kinase regulator [Azonexus fungiphilus]NHC05968.1 nucleoside diphosphate kinase regulator [Azonexus fungiphilus]RKT59300.1 regulator of nucleoside diphosphate kinase [Azonexus fungiphilus]
MQQTNLIISESDFVRLMSIQPPPDLRAELERAIVIPDESMNPDIVTMGSRVRYTEHETGNSREVEIVFPDEAAPGAGKVSVFAPVGAALIGLGVGHEIDWDFPGGSTRRLTVVEVIQPASTAPH